MLTKNDFLNVFGDAIQQHEGWGEIDKVTKQWVKTPSIINNNPGNIRFVGQIGATAGPNNFCVMQDFISGRALLLHDLTLKMAKFNSIRAIITVYAPPSENNTEAYINSVVTFFHKRNIPVTDTMPITDILNLKLDVALIINDALFGMEQWASFQGSLDLAAALMPEWAFSTRYANRPMTIADTYAITSPMGTLYAIKEAVTRPIVAQFNEGQKLNSVFYLLVQNGEAGGVHYHGDAVSFNAPFSAFSNVLFEGTAFTEYDSRALFHEFIHCLFTLTGKPDYLHDYLVAHGGYQNNLLVDLKVVYADISAEYKDGTNVVDSAHQAIQIATTDTNPADRPKILRLLNAVWLALKSW